MSDTEQNTLQLLSAISTGDVEAGKRLFIRLYDELHVMAKRAMRKATPGHVLQTTALIHEAYLKLIPRRNLCCNDRKHFFATAGRAMRQVLISDIRSRSAAKRGKNERPVPLTENMLHELKFDNSLPDKLETLNKVLEKLESNENLRSLCTLVDLRIFAGMTFNKIGEMMECSESKVKRDWSFVRAMIMDELKRTT